MLLAVSKLFTTNVLPLKFVPAAIASAVGTLSVITCNVSPAAK